MRLPKGFWEWVLLFSPAAALYAAILISNYRLAQGFEWGLYQMLLGAIAGAVIASVICGFAGYVLTKPAASPYARCAWGFLAAILVALFNVAVILTVSTMVTG